MFKPLPGGRGLLSLNGKEIKTPNFILATKRGAPLHLTPDSYATAPVGAIFTEHFIDHAGFACEAAKTLPVNAQLKLVSARSCYLDGLNKPNTNDVAGISTFQGTQLVNVELLARHSSVLEPDMVVSVHDIPNMPGPAGKNRSRKMEARSERWFNTFRTHAPKNSMLLASVAAETQNAPYLKQADGLYSVDPELQLPSGTLRVCGVALSLAEIEKRLPHFDLFYCDIDSLSEKGLAMESPSQTIDLHDAQYERDMSILGKTGYAKAYVHHLLNAREMTAQVILQQHNLHIVENFFERC